MACRSIFLMACCIFVLLASPAVAADRPNILWLSAEDIGPHLGCYGYEIETPAIDAFSRGSLRFKNAWSTYPVCAPARTTVITGMYATSLGAGNMRCAAAKPASLKLLPELLRDSGYYCTNNSKKDYNLKDVADVWNQSSSKAHWKNRPEEKPFFAVFNFTGTHESKIRNKNHEQQIDPKSVSLFPYWPDTPEVRKDWAQYLDNIQTLDAWFGKHLKSLKDAQIADDTIVLFWGDHGSGMPRHKRFAGDSGLRVPMIVHVPEKWKSLWSNEYQAGATSDRLVSFVDLAPTVLRAAGVTVPETMQGSTFLGAETTAPKYNYGIRNRMDERNDVSRSITDGKYIYIRNFMSHLPHGQLVVYQQMTPTTSVWHQLFLSGKLNDVQAAFWKPRAKEELYDLEADPHETVNLASEPAKKEKLDQLRAALRKKQLQIVDLDLVPESVLHKFEQETGKPRISYAQSQGFRMQDLLDAAEGKSITENLISARVELQYWAIVNLISQADPLSSETQKSISSLMENSPSPTIRVKAAECCLSNDFSSDRAMEVLLLLANMDESNYFVAFNALDCLDRYRERLDEDGFAKIRALKLKPPHIDRGDNYLEKLLTRFSTSNN